MQTFAKTMTAQPVGLHLITMVGLLLVLLTAGMSYSLPVQAAPAAPAEAMSIRLGTYFGGSLEDYVYGVAMDATGIYLTGRSYSGDLPGVSDTLASSNDLFVAKLNPAGTALLWSVFLGGSGHDQGNAIVSDGMGSVFVTGSTWSNDFPVTPGADESTFGGFTDVVTIRLDAASGAVRWATYLGEDNQDEGNGIALDGQGHVYITGWWAQNDALVAKYDAASGAGIWGQAFSGRSEAKANALAIDSQGDIWVTGTTDIIGSTSDFPIAGPALRQTCGAANGTGECGADAFVTKLSSQDGAILYSTFLGGDYNGSTLGSGRDEGTAIAIDEGGYVYVAGKTLATNFPTKDALQANKRGSDNFADGFLTKITPDGSQIVYSTYLGGDKWDEARALVVSAAGEATVAGFTSSQNFPLNEPLQNTLGSGVCEVGANERFCYDTFVTQVGSSGQLGPSTYLGGRFDDRGYGLARGDDGMIVVAGTSDSRADEGFAVAPGAFQPQKSFRDDGFVVGMGRTNPNPLTQRVHLPLVIQP